MNGAGQHSRRAGSFSSNGHSPRRPSIHLDGTRLALTVTSDHVGEVTEAGLASRYFHLLTSAPDLQAWSSLTLPVLGVSDGGAFELVRLLAQLAHLEELGSPDPLNPVALAGKLQPELKPSVFHGTEFVQGVAVNGARWPLTPLERDSDDTLARDGDAVELPVAAHEQDPEGAENAWVEPQMNLGWTR